MSRWKHTWLIGFLLTTGLVCANPGPLLRAGNRALAEEQFDKAIEAFQQAAEQDPDSAEIQYNLGNAQYRAGLFNEAAYAFQNAVMTAESDSLRSRSLYNLGNSLAKQSEAMREESPGFAAANFRQAAWFYRMALDYNPDFSDAAYNLEIAQHLAVQMDEQARQKAAQQQQKNDLIKHIHERLREFIERQTRLNAENDTGNAQYQLETETRALAGEIKNSGLHKEYEIPDGTTMKGPLKETFEHTVAAADAMAVPDQPRALQELKTALGSAPQNPDQQENDSDENSDDDDDSDMDDEQSDEQSEMYTDGKPFGEFSEFEEIRGVPPPNRNEKDILTEEIRNQEKRKENKIGKYKPVDKDW